jgi:hypothetical protein
MKPTGISGMRRRSPQKHRISELAMNSKDKNIRDLYVRINESVTCCHLVSNFVKDGNENLLAYSHTILNRWKNSSY